ncbi:MAG: protoglobin family protein [Pirellulales bacterium]
MRAIDEPRLETDTAYRYEYLCEFIGFGPADAAAIHGAAGVLAGQIGQIVETTYAKLLAFDATARHFVPRQHGFAGDPPASLEQLHQNHEQIKFRKEHLLRYLMQMFGAPFNARTANYLDMVGKMHTPKAGNPAIDVPLVQMNALMGLLSDALLDVILQSQLPPEKKSALARAFNKLLWIQNDLITRHYSP